MCYRETNIFLAVTVIWNSVAMITVASNHTVTMTNTFCLTNRWICCAVQRSDSRVKHKDLHLYNWMFESLLFELSIWSGLLSSKKIKIVEPHMSPQLRIQPQTFLVIKLGVNWWMHVQSRRREAAGIRCETPSSFSKQRRWLSAKAEWVSMMDEREPAWTRMQKNIIKSWRRIWLRFIFQQDNKMNVAEWPSQVRMSKYWPEQWNTNANTYFTWCTVTYF